jgi:hypothetical protein
MQVEWGAGDAGFRVERELVAAVAVEGRVGDFDDEQHVCGLRVRVAASDGRHLVYRAFEQFEAGICMKDSRLAHALGLGSRYPVLCQLP